MWVMNLNEKENYLLREGLLCLKKNLISLRKECQKRNIDKSTSLDGEIQMINELSETLFDMEFGKQNDHT